MSSDPNHWIDDELRRVPLPAGLLARLRALGELSEDQLDALLRGVVVPEMLLVHLQEIPADEAIEVRLADVAIPEGLLADLAFIPQDEALRDVVVPADLLVELRRIPPRPRRRISLTSLAMAASLLLMIGGGYLLAVTGLTMSAYNQLPEPFAAVFGVEDPPLDLTVPAEIPVELLVHEDAADRRAAAAETITDNDTRTPAINIRNWQEELDSLLPPGPELSDSIIPIKYGILGQAQAADDRTPDLEVLAPPAPRGLEPPLVPGFDRQFLITQRTQPVVSLAAAKKLGDGPHVAALVDQLSQNRLPLWTQTGGFDRLRQLRAKGRLPAPQEVHAEDFLAAMDFQYAPVPAGDLGIRTAAGPSPFGEAGARLLQIGVQAGPVKRTAAPLHVTLVVDVSDSMRWGERLDVVRQGVTALARQLAPGDHVSLIAFNDGAEIVLEDSPAEDRDALAEALDALSPSGGTNIGPALVQAAAATASPLAMQHPQRRVVVISEGVPALNAAAAVQVRLLLGDMAHDGATVDVIELADGGGPNEGLAQLATAAGTTLLTAGEPVALSRRLVEQLLGVSPVVANYASLRVKFNPDVVEKYRLIGHETTTAGGLLPATVESTLLGGEAATVLYEVWLYPDAPLHVANVEVRWHNAAGGEMPPVTFDVRTRQFAPSFAEAPLSLQAAAIAAEAAEVLRQSPFAPAPRNQDLSDVLSRAEEVNPRLKERASYQRFLRVLREEVRD